MADEHVQPLICKTYALRVSIHCEGCKRKAKKILQSIDGVYKANIDLRQQRIEVTGNVDAQTLIKKLIKAGFKHTELWPEKTNSKKKKQAKTQNKEKQNDGESSEESGCDNEKEPVKVVIQDPAGGNAGKNNDGVNVVKVIEGPAGVVQIQEPMQTVIAGNHPLEKKVTIAVPGGGENEPGPGSNEKSGGGGGGGSGGGGGGKKKKKKGHKANNNIGNDVQVQHSGDALAGTGLANQGQGPVSVPLGNQSPPRHHMYPSNYYAPPVHTVSHHTAYPSSSYSASYYAAPQPYSYAYYVQPGMGREVEDPPSDYYEIYTSQPSDSFEFFSDENPNGCSVM